MDLPDDLLEQTKIAAIKRRTSVKALVVEGLRTVLAADAAPAKAAGALDRLRDGYHLGGRPLSRDQAHGR